ncbi:MAG: LptF/LptG family permease [Bacteroidales bacterium]|nr:LptF/LptG family permease [Bacteroidales bacterium]
MKKIHILIIKSFIGPFIITFAISIFFFLMQFIWLWIEDMVGKGLEWYFILKVLFYSAAMLVPMALPLAVLLASVMTFGNLGEHFELTAMKTSGISLWRIMSSLIVFIILLSIGAFYFSNNVLPYTNLKYAGLLYDLSRKRPELNIKTGVFNNDIDGYSIKIEDKDPDTGMMYGFMIYNHTKQKGNKDVTVADSGEMNITRDQKNMIVTLYSGSNYTEMKEKHNSSVKEYPYRHDRFTKQTIVFKLPDISMKKSDESLFEKHYEIMDTKQLSYAIDSLKKEYYNRAESYNRKLIEFNYFKHEKRLAEIKDNKIKHRDSISRYQNPEKLISRMNLDSIYEKMSISEKQKALQSSLTSANRLKTNIENNSQSLSNRLKWLKKHQLAWYKKFSLSFACLVFFFIGAPLGAIIRKGGFGLPILVSVLLFMFYYVLFSFGEKAAIESAVPVFLGAWLAPGILFPIGVYVSYQATKDSKIINIQKFEEILKKISRILRLNT